MATSASSSPSDQLDPLQQQLQESIEQYQFAAKATNDAMYDSHLRDGVVLWNDALFTQYGYGRAEPTETVAWWAQHIHPEDALRIDNELIAWLNSGEPNWQGEYRFQRADGSYAVVRDRAFVQRDKRGQPIRIIGSLLDITREKELEHAKDEFISLVSHQLRTPLTIIRMSGEIIGSGMAGPVNEAQQAYATHITDASVRLIRLVSNILTISRIELDRVTIDPIPSDVNTLIQKHIDELKPLSQDKAITVTFNPELLDPIPVDPVMFAQIALNLLANALNYSRPKEGKVDVSFTKDAEGFLLRVADNGIGIPKSAQKHIFERFYRAPNTSHVEGTGLGLYLSCLIAKSFGGQIWFESTINKGTTFYLRIPPEGMLPKAGELTLDEHAA